VSPAAAFILQAAPRRRTAALYRCATRRVSNERLRAIENARASVLPQMAPTAPRRRSARRRERRRATVKRRHRRHEDRAAIPPSFSFQFVRYRPWHAAGRHATTPRSPSIIQSPFR
jgi:hypothetical protein